MPRPPLLLVWSIVAVLASGLLTGCGGDEPTAYNDADVTFASDMVSHHEQAVEMADMVAERPAVASDVASFAATIRDEQGAEVKKMSAWLKDWDKPAPDSDPDVDMDMGGAMEGMMSHEQMTTLEDTPDADFDRAWLELMTAHHQGALEMARTEIADGTYPAAVALARDIVTTQSAEIAQMKTLLATAG